MSTSAARAADTTASLGFSDLLSDDGTHLRAWTNDPEGVIDGPTVVLCNGLGTAPWVWPAFFVVHGALVFPVDFVFAGLGVAALLVTASVDRPVPER